MSQIRIKLDLPFEDALHLVVILADEAHECEKMAQFFDEKEKPEHSKFYRKCADRTDMIKEKIKFQLQNAKNIYIGGCEDESTRA